jgi:hypothetical protein
VFSLSPIANQTSERAHIDYTLSREAHVRVRIFDVLGREIARLMDEVRPAENLTLTWDGKERTGRAPAGVYFVRFESGGESATTRLVLLK